MTQSVRALLCHLCTDYKTHCPLGYFILKGTLRARHKYTEFQCTLISKLQLPKCGWNYVIECKAGFEFNAS